jgi:hypothetical protein
MRRWIFTWNWILFDAVGFPASARVSSVPQGTPPGDGESGADTGQLVLVVPVRKIVEHEFACPCHGGRRQAIELARFDPAFGQCGLSGIAMPLGRSGIKGQDAERARSVEDGRPSPRVGPVQDSCHLVAALDEDVERVEIEMQEPVAC